MNNAELLDVYRRIVCGEDPRGNFLTAFARALLAADYENFKVMRPAAMLLAWKYALCPGAELISPTNAGLEQLATNIVPATKADGVVIALFYPNRRVEVVAALQEETLDLVGALRKLADHVQDGDGQPIGDHLHTITPP